MTKERNITFDLLKGLAIFLMMLCHLAQFNYQFIYSFHMPLFFIAAGCFAKGVGANIGGGISHIRKDSKRLLVPYVVTMLMLSAWGILQAIFKQDWTMALRHPLSLLWASADTFYTNKFGLVYAGPMWFLIALFWIREIFYYGASWIVQHIRKFGDEVVVVVCLLVSALVVLTNQMRLDLPWCIFQGLGAIEFYAIGWYFSRHQIPKWLKWLCIGCWPLAIVYGHIGLANVYYKCYPLDILGACGAVLVLYGIFDWISKTIQCHCPKIYTDYQTPLQWLGINSLAVLCMHTFELHSSLLFSILCRLPFDITGGWLIALRMAFAIGLAWLVMHMPGLKKVYGK